MIPINELRIGNVVNRQHYEFDFRTTPTTTRLTHMEEILIDEIDDEGSVNKYVYFGGEIESISVENLHGIPLSPEILESYGFVKSENQYSSSGYFYTLTIQTLDDNNYYDTIVFASEGTWVKIVAIQHIKFQYLHQLQNIYFALCGTELTKNGLLDGK